VALLAVLHGGCWEGVVHHGIDLRGAPLVSAIGEPGGLGILVEAAQACGTGAGGVAEDAWWEIAGINSTFFYIQWVQSKFLYNMLRAKSVATKLVLTG